MDDIIRDVNLELAEGTKLGRNGAYPTHKEFTKMPGASTLKKEDKLLLSDVEKTAHEVTEMIHFGGAIE